MMDVLLVGGNHWDETWIANQELIAGESIPVRTSRQPGGAVANMARALRGFGLKAELASVYGHEAPPIEGAHVHCVPDAPSARYVSLETAEGQVLHGFADMAIYEQHMGASWYANLVLAAQQAKAVVWDCNGPEGALPSLPNLKFQAALAVSPAKVARLIPILGNLQILFCNAAEAQFLGAHLDQVAQAVVTYGADGAAIVRGGREVARYAAPAWQPRSANGLGDRLAGLTLAHVLGGMNLDRALERALEDLPC